MPSIYVRCSQALEDLRRHPPKDQGGVFTDHDIVTKALSDDMSPEEFKQAMKETNNLCGRLYRNGTLCRYGPVTPPLGDPDYARIANRIVYGDAELGPEVWATPNGAFLKLPVRKDDIAHKGRRENTIRNDLLAWEQQGLRPTVGGLRRRADALEAQIRELQRQRGPGALARQS